MKQILKSGDEYDAVTGWRKYMIWKPGELSAIKRRLRRRLRREARQEIRNYDESEY